MNTFWKTINPYTETPRLIYQALAQAAPAGLTQAELARATGKQPRAIRRQLPNLLKPDPVLTLDGQTAAPGLIVKLDGRYHTTATTPQILYELWNLADRQQAKRKQHKRDRATFAAARTRKAPPHQSYDTMTHDEILEQQKELER